MKWNDETLEQLLRGGPETLYEQQELHHALWEPAQRHISAEDYKYLRENNPGYLRSLWRRAYYRQMRRRPLYERQRKLLAYWSDPVAARQVQRDHYWSDPEAARQRKRELHAERKDEINAQRRARYAEQKLR